jgi:AraC-like DNA-binding protein
VALLRRELDRHALASAAREFAIVHFITRLAELRPYLTREPPVMLVAELTGADGAPLGPALEVLHRRSPFLPILLFTPLSSAEVQASTDLVHRGVAIGVVTAGGDTLGYRLQRFLREQHDQGETATLLRIIEPIMPRALPEVVSACVMQSAYGSSVLAVADALSMPMRTLERRVQDAGLPRVRRMLLWCRLLRAALRIERGGALKEVAASLGYPTFSAFTVHFSRHVGITFTVLCSGGAVEYLTRRFALELSSQRRTDNE